MSDTLDGVPALSALRYAELSPGDAFGPFTEPLAQATSDGLRGELGASSPGRLAPPGVLPLLTLRLLRRALRGIIPGGVLTRQRFVAHAELPAAGEIVAEVWVAVAVPVGPRPVHELHVRAAPRGGARRRGGVDDPGPSDRMSWAPFPRVSHTVTTTEIDAYAARSGDRNPLHVDPAFAAAGPFGTIVAHGPIGLQTVFEALTRWLGAEQLPPGGLADVAFRGPVRAGDTITCTRGASRGARRRRARARRLPQPGRRARARGARRGAASAGAAGALAHATVPRDCAGRFD